MAPAPPRDADDGWRLLGQHLAELRKAGGFTQESLATNPLIYYSRSTIANVERGRQPVGRDFWEHCDAALDTGGALAAEYDKLCRSANSRRRTVTTNALASPTSRTFDQADIGCNPPTLPSHRWQRSERDTGRLTPQAHGLPGPLEVLGEHPSRQVSHAHVERYLPASLGSGGGWADNIEVLRRTVLWAVAAAAGSPLVGDRVQEPPPSGVDQAVMPADVEHWQEAVWEYGYAYHVVAREDLLPDLCADLVTIKRQLNSHLAVDDVEAKPIAAVTSQLVALAAMSCTDLGYAREGRHLWRFARRYADLSENSLVQHWVKGHEITSGIYQHRPPQVLASLADQALAGLSNANPSAGKAELLGGQAQLLSLMGKAHEADTALNRLRDTYERLPSTTTSLRDSIFGWPEHRLRHTESFASSVTGPTSDAYRAQERALTLYAPTRPISRCQIELHRARCLIRDGSIREGLSHASTAVHSLAHSRRKEFVLAVADHVFEAVPQSQRSRPECQELNDLVRTARSLPRS